MIGLAFLSISSAQCQGYRSMYLRRVAPQVMCFINDSKGTKTYLAVENADYQTQANAFRSLFNEKMKQ
jgi:hypothetical protein